MLVDIRRAPMNLQLQAVELGSSPTSPEGPMTSHDEVDRLLEVITVDGYNTAEQVTGFYEVFTQEVPLPITATVVGAPVRVVGIDIAEHGEELTARCERATDGQDLGLADLVFPPATPAAWIHAAYRRSPRPDGAPGRRTSRVEAVLAVSRPGQIRRVGSQSTAPCRPGWQVLNVDRSGPPCDPEDRAQRRERVSRALPSDREALRDRRRPSRVSLGSESTQLLDVGELDRDRPGDYAPVNRLGLDLALRR